jgi:hypothetical protein
MLTSTGQFLVDARHSPPDSNSPSIPLDGFQSMPKPIAICLVEAILPIFPYRRSQYNLVVLIPGMNVRPMVAAIVQKIHRYGDAVKGRDYGHRVDSQVSE